LGSDIIPFLPDTRIAALGIARSYCYESPKPTEFGTAGSMNAEGGALRQVVRPASCRELARRFQKRFAMSER
jgi:hypothetical protein